MILKIIGCVCCGDTVEVSSLVSQHVNEETYVQVGEDGEYILKNAGADSGFMDDIHLYRGKGKILCFSTEV